MGGKRVGKSGSKNKRSRTPAWIIAHTLTIVFLAFVAPMLNERTYLAGVFTFLPTTVYMGSSLVFALVSFAVRSRFKWLHAGCLFCCVLFVGGFQVRLPGRGEADIKVMTLNVLQGQASVREVAEYMAEHDVDVALFQESRTSAGDFGQQVADELGGCRTLSRDETSIVSRIGMRDTAVTETEVLWGRSVLGATVGEREPVRVVCVHWPIPQFGFTPKGFFARLRRGEVLRKPVIEATERMALKGQLPTLVGGDFNTPPLQASYRRLSREFQNSFAAVGNGFGFTYRNNLPVTRIDHFWTRGRIRPLTCEAGPSFGSDHRSVIATYAVD